MIYNVRRPLNNLSSEEIVLGIEPDKEISMSGATHKTNSSYVVEWTPNIVLRSHMTHIGTRRIRPKDMTFKTKTA